MTRERHIPDARWIAYGQGSLEAPDREEIEPHLLRCDRCRAAAKEYRAILAAVSENDGETVSPKQPGPLERAISLRRAEIVSHAKERAPFGRPLGKAVKMSDAVNDGRAGIALAPSQRWTRGWVVAFAAVVLLGALSGAWFSQSKLHSNYAALNSSDEAKRETAMREISLNHLKQLGISIYMYADSHQGLLPPMNSIDTAKAALLPYAQSDDFFFDPVAHAPYLPNPALSGTTMDQYEGKRSQIIAYYEGTPKADGTRCAVFLDGMARRLTADQWQDDKRLSAIMDVTTDTTRNDYGFH
jgi:hypothetical protein